MRPGRRLAGLAGVVAALLVLGTPPVAGQSNRLEIRSLTFEGNSVMPDDSLKRAIVNRQTECKATVFKLLLFCPLGADWAIDHNYLQPRELPLDALRLQVYYMERGYRDMAVDTVVTRGDRFVDITFRIDEGVPVRVDSLEVLLTDELPDSSALEDLPLEVGDPLSGILLDEARDTIQSRLRNTGYAWADVLVNYTIPSESHDATVTLDVAPGPLSRFGEISVAGNEILEAESVRRMLPFRQGSVYRRSQVLEGQRNLYNLDIIQSAQVEETRPEAGQDTVIPIHVTVAEGDLHRVRAGLGWTTADCLTAEARWASRDFYGGARRLEARARMSNLFAPQLHQTACPLAGSGTFAELNGRVSLALTQPWIFSPRNSLTATAYVERQSLPDVFVREALGFNLSLRRSIGRRASLTLSYQPELARLSAAEIFFCASFLACQEQDIRIFQQANWLAPLGLNAARDRRNSVLNPTRGYLAVVDLEHAASYTGSNFEYSRIVGEITGYRPFANVVLAGRLRSGIVGRGRFLELKGKASEDLVHPQKRFYAGGANSVRGFPENRLGPRVLTTDVADLLSVPPAGSQAACQPEQIVDDSCDPTIPDGEFSPRAVGGNVVIEGNMEVRFPLPSGFQGVTFLDFGQVWKARQQVRLSDLEFSPGVGVRYFSPIGPIRVDLGYRFRGGQELNVATSLIRPFDPQTDNESDRIQVVTASGDRQPIDWVRTDQITFLSRTATYGASPAFSLSRLQLHISIGQAF